MSGNILYQWQTGEDFNCFFSQYSQQKKLMSSVSMSSFHFKSIFVLTLPLLLLLLLSNLPILWHHPVEKSSHHWRYTSAAMVYLLWGFTSCFNMATLYWVVDPLSAEALMRRGAQRWGHCCESQTAASPGDNMRTLEARIMHRGKWRRLLLFILTTAQGSYIGVDCHWAEFMS